MKISEILYEEFDSDLAKTINTAYSQNTAKTKVTSLRAKLADQGWACIAQGHYSIVFEKNNMILKINKVKDPAYDYFVKLTKQHPNKHFPKISENLKLIKGYNAYIIEKLYPETNIDLMYSISNAGHYLEQKAHLETDIYISNYIKEKAEWLAEDSPSFYEALKIVAENCPDEYELDLQTSGNLMRRKDRTMVISDPYAMGSGW